MCWMWNLCAKMNAYDRVNLRHRAKGFLKTLVVEGRFRDLQFQIEGILRKDINRNGCSPLDVGG